MVDGGGDDGGGGDGDDNRGAAGRLAKDSDTIGIATKGVRVVMHEFEAEAHVVEARVGRAVFNLLWQAKVAERREAVIDGDHNGSRPGSQILHVV